MFSNVSIRVILSLAALAMLASASPAESPELTVRTFAEDGPMDAHPAGHFELGRDGVMRSYGPNSEVLDYRQLSEEEVKNQVKRDIAFLEERGDAISMETRDLAENGADGRLVTARDELLGLKARSSEMEKRKKCARAVSSPVMRGIDFPLAPRNCPYPHPCECLADCPRPQCNSCYFPQGPGNPAYCMFRQ